MISIFKRRVEQGGKEEDDEVDDDVVVIVDVGIGFRFRQHLVHFSGHIDSE